MDDDVLLADRREAVAAVVADALGIAGLEGGKAEIRAVVGDELAGVLDAEDAVDDHDVLRLRLELLNDEAAQRLRRGRLDLEPHENPAAAALERGLEKRARGPRPPPRSRCRCRG